MNAVMRKAIVVKALKNYKEKQEEGYNIMRYAQQQLIEVVPSYDASKDFMNWYPRNASYVLLRLAAAGRLQYKEPL